MHTYKLQELADRNGRDITEYLQLLDEVVKPDFSMGSWVAGGSLRRICDNTDPFASDIDVFFKCESQMTAWLDRIKATPEINILKTYNNAHNTTLTIEWNNREVILQAIHIRYYDSAIDVIDSFDYTICQFITDGTDIIVGPYALYDLGRKRLVIHRLTYAVASMRRMLKYKDQGFHICSGMMTDLLTRVAQNPELINSKFAYID